MKKCPVSGCPKKFRKRSTFTKHYNKYHNKANTTWDKP